MNRPLTLLALCSFNLFFGWDPALSAEPAAETTAAAEGATAIWVTSIAPLGANKFVAATADGLLLREATVYSFEPSDPNQLHPLYTHPAAVWRVDSTSDGGKVASVDYRGNLVIFDSVTGEAKMHEKAFERWCQSMMIAPSGTSVVAGNEAGKVMIWDLIAGKVIKTAELGGHAITGLAISPDQSTLAATDGGGHVHLLSWPSLEPAGKIKISDQTAWCVAFVDDGKSLLVGSSDRNLYKCDAIDGATPQCVTKGTDWITQIAVSPSGQVAVSEVGGRLHFPTTGGSDSMDAASGVWALCWNANSQLYAGTRKDGIVVAGRSWKWAQPEPPKKEEPVAETPTKEEAAAEKPMKEEPKKDAPKKEEPKKEEPKKDAPKKDAPKKDAPKKDAPKKDAPKKEEPKKETPKPEAKPAEEPKKDAPKPEVKPAEEPKKEAPKPEAKPAEEPKKEAPKPDAKPAEKPKPAGE